MNILVADDHALFREGLSLLLSKVFPSTVVNEAHDVEEALAELRRSPARDLVIFDLMMPGMESFLGLKRLRSEFPHIPVAIVSMSNELDDIHTAIENGAAGYILKSSDHKVLEAAIMLLLAGQTYVPPHALSILGKAPPRNIEVQDQPIENLTPREREVLAHLMEGQSNKAIARALGVLEGTVKKHTHAIFQKFEVTNRTQATVFARNQGFRGV